MFCEKCDEDITFSKTYVDLKVCPFCRHHHYMNTNERINFISDFNSFQEYFSDLESKNILNFPNYSKKLDFDKKNTNLLEAVTTGIAKIGDFQFVLSVMDKKFRMGSMGTIVGEKITLGAELALKIKKPYIVFTASGGARMQEGVLSLMQMAKTTSAFNRLKENKILTIVIITNPTTGGVSASFVNMADIILAEPQAVYSFAGKKVIEQTINEKLPIGFQSTNNSYNLGHIDALVDRSDMKKTIELFLKIHNN